MTIASISGIKNESDVIESFVRHNAKFIDDFYFIDDSADKTPAILAQLAGEGFRIFTIKFDTRDYQHSKIMTNATRFINQERKYDWIFIWMRMRFCTIPPKSNLFIRLKLINIIKSAYCITMKWRRIKCRISTHPIRSKNALTYVRRRA